MAATHAFQASNLVMSRVLSKFSKEVGMGLVKFFALGISALLFVGCGGSNENKHGDGAKNPNEGGAGENGRPLQLTGEQNAEFSNWKNAPFKACEIEHIFLGKAPADPGIDLNKWSEQLTGQFYIEADDVIAFFGDPIHYFGNHSVSERFFNSSPGGFQKLKAEQSGSECTVFVNGEKVFAVKLLKGISLLGAYKKDDNGLKTKLNSLITVKSYSSSPLDRIENLGLSEVLTNFFAITEDKIKVLSTRFALNETQFQRKFPSSKTWSNDVHALTFKNHPDIHPFGLDQTLIKGKRHSIQKLLPTVKDEPIELVIDSSHFASWKNLQIKFESKIKLELLASWFSPDNISTQYEISAKELSLAPSDDNRAVTCFLNRRNDDSTISSNNNSNKLWPPYNSSYCSVYASDWMMAVDRNEKFNQLINDLFSNLDRQSIKNYFQWDRLLTELIEKHYENNSWENWTFYHTIPLVKDAVTNAEIIKNELKKFSHDLKNLVSNNIHVATKWSVNNQLITNNRMNRIFSSLDNSATTFPEATHDLWSELQVNPFGSDNEINFASSINAEYKKKFKNMEVTSLKAIAQDWLKEKKMQALKKRFSLSEVSSWEKTLEFGANFAEKHLDREVYFIESKMKELMEHALKENWSGETFATIEHLAPVAKFKLECTLAKSNILGLAKCVGFDSFSIENHKLLNSKYGNRYIKMADFILGWAPKLEDFSNQNTRRELVNNFFNPLWKKANNEEFERAKNQLNSLLERLVKVDGLDRFSVQTDIRNLLEKFK